MYRTRLAFGLCKCQREVSETICDIWMGCDNVLFALVGQQHAAVRRVKAKHNTMLSVRFPVGLHDGNFYEKEREEGENGGLDEADE